MARQISREEYERLLPPAAAGASGATGWNPLSALMRSVELQLQDERLREAGERLQFEAMGLDYEAVSRARRQAAGQALKETASRRQVPYQLSIPGVNPTLFALRAPDVALPLPPPPVTVSPHVQLELATGAAASPMVRDPWLESFLSTPRSPMSPQEAVSLLGNQNSVAAMAVAQGATDGFQRERGQDPGGNWLSYFQDALTAEGYTPAEQAEILPALLDGRGGKPKNAGPRPRRVIAARQGPKAPPPRRSILAALRALDGVVDEPAVPPRAPMRANAAERQAMEEMFVPYVAPRPSAVSRVIPSPRNARMAGQLLAAVLAGGGGLVGAALSSGGGE